MIESAMSAMTTPIELKSTCATKTVSPFADGIGESQVTTFVPAVWAASAAGEIWSPALLEIMTAFIPWVGALVMNSIWPATLFSAVGPTNESFSGFWSSVAASVAPLLAWSNGRMPRNFGRSIILTLWPGVALTAAPPDADADPEADAEALADAEAEPLAAADSLGAADDAAADGDAATLAAAEAAPAAEADGDPPLDELHALTSTTAASSVNDVLCLNRIACPPPKPHRDGGKVARSYRKSYPRRPVAFSPIPPLSRPSPGPP